MLGAARRRRAARSLVQADMRHLPLERGSLAAVVAYYSVQHLPRTDLPAALAEVARVLDADGIVALATHLGEGELYHEEFLGRRIEVVGGTLYRRTELSTASTRPASRWSSRSTGVRSPTRPPRRGSTWWPGAAHRRRTVRGATTVRMRALPGGTRR